MTVIVGTDFSREGAAVAVLAAELARRRGEELIVAHVVDGPLLPAAAASTRIEAEAHRLRARDCRVRPVLLYDGPCGKRLATLAMQEEASVLVLGAQGAGMRSPLGTVASQAIRHTSCPVLAVRKPERLWGARASGPLRVIVPFALDASDEGLCEALTLVAATGDIDVDFLHCAPVPEPVQRWRHAAPLDEAALRGYFGSLPAGLAVRSILERDAFGRLDGHVSDVARARDVDLIVCGSHHRHGVARMREGSIAEGIVLHAPVSVLVARAPAAADQPRISTPSDERDNSRA